MNKKYRVQTNSMENIEVLLQETYDEASRHFNEVQNEINKLTGSINLGDDNISVDEKVKYSKAMHDFIIDKKNAISMKFEIAKFLGEIVKHNGSVEAALSDGKFGKATKLDLSSLRKATAQSSGDETDSYDLKK